MEIVAGVASVLTIISFIFAIWQNQKRKAVEQALRAIENISKTALIEVQEIYDLEADDTRSAQLRTIGAHVTGVLNTCWPFLDVRKKRFEKPKLSDHPYARMTQKPKTGAEQIPQLQKK